MKISYNWLKNYLDLSSPDCAPEALAEVLPLLGFEVDEMVKLGPPPLDNVVVGEVLVYDQHPNADRLRVCKVRTEEGGAPHSIVCGAKNFEAGDRVMVALPGAVLPGNFKIKKSELRGEPSEGMMCSAKELNIGQDHDGILVLDRDIPLGTPINEVYAEADTVFDLEVTPNRPDALCHIGIARELAARLGLRLKYPEVKAGRSNPSQGEPLLESVEIRDWDACPHYTAIRIKGVKVGPSPKWLRQAIEAVGLRPINNVVDVTNYVLMETGQPLHAFDAAKIRGRRIIVRKAAEGEEITTLDEKKRRLSKDITVIADAERPLVVAGLMGSLDAEVDESTSDVVLEAAYFDPLSIRAASRKLGLSSDSSYRFERGVDPKGVEFASLRAVDLILQVAGGVIDGNLMEEGAPPATITEVELRPERVRRFVGFEVGDDEIRDALESLELAVSVHDEADGSVRWDVGIPSFRGDLVRDVDLIEEFVRVYGTDKIPETEVVARGISPEDDRVYRFNEAVAQTLCGQNFNEAFLYTLRDPEEIRYFFGDRSHEVLALDNPLQSDQSHLRPSLIPGLLDVVRLNQARGTGATRFFERGHVFRELRGELMELVSVGFVIVAEQLRREWRGRELADFYTARKLVESVLELAGLPAAKLNFQPIGECRLWQPGHAAEAGDFTRMGYLATAGLVNLQSLKDRWDLTTPVVAGSVLLSPGIFERKLKRGRHGAISNQPGSSKDLALIADRSVLAGQVEKDLAGFARKAAQGFECEEVRVFDLYEGEGLPEGKKSLALTMRFRAKDRTLTDKEVNAAFEAVQKAIEEKTDYQIRK